MTDQIGAIKPNLFHDDAVEHRRQIVDYLAAAGDRANAATPKDGSELTQMLKLDALDVAITADTHDLDLTGYSVVRLDPDAAWNLTGIVADPGRFLVLINVSTTYTIVCIDQDSGSTDVNQFEMGPGSSSLLPDDAMIFWYDPTTERWRRLVS
jgi:hypothetical protein